MSERNAEWVIELLGVIASRLRRDGRPEADALDDIRLALRDIVYAWDDGGEPDERDVRRVEALTRKLRSSDVPELKGLALLLRRLATEPPDSPAWREADEVIDGVEKSLSGYESMRDVVKLADKVLDRLNRFASMYREEPWFALAGDVMQILAEFLDSDDNETIPDFYFFRQRKLPRELRKVNPRSYKLLQADLRVKEKLMDALMDLYKNPSERTGMVAERIIRSLPKIYRKLWSDLSDVYDKER